MLGAVVIAAGDMGSRHAQHWHSAGAKVIGIFDPDMARAKAVAQPLSAEVFDKSEQYLNRDDVQVVSVCSPTFLHPQYAIAVLNAGKHVLCEKPAALKLEDALAMKTAAKKNDRQLRVGFMRRFDPAHKELRDACETIGRPVLAHASIAAGIRPKRLMHDAEANGGPVIDMCCHIFDQWASFFGGQALKVRAKGFTFGEGKKELKHIQHKALDSVHISLNYPNSSVGHIQISWGLPSGIDYLEHHYYMGADGMVTVNWPEEITRHSSQGHSTWHSRGLDPWQVEIKAFHDELRGGSSGGLATIDDGIEALKTSLAVLQSVQERRSIKLSDW